MNELAALLPIAPAAVGTATVQTVDARKLYAYLEVGKDFSTWIKDRIDAYDFAADVDYVIESRSPESGTGNRGARIDYHLTLDTAKEIAMVERNDKGKLARRYFIDCERRLHDAAQLPVNFAEALRLAADQAELIQVQEQALLIAGPKAAALDQLTTAEGSFCLREAAKNIGQAPMKFIAKLAEKKWIYRLSGGWVAYQDRIHAGYLRHKITTITREGEDDKIVTQCLVTAKGIIRLAELFKKEEAA